MQHERQPLGGTQVSARPTDSARSASSSAPAPESSVTISSGNCSSYDASGRALRERSTSMQIRPTTVVSHPAKFSIMAASWRASRSHASCTASSASGRDPSVR